jgi:hypothetical protein
LTKSSDVYHADLTPYLNWKIVNWPPLDMELRMDQSYSSLPGPVLPNGRIVELNRISFQFPVTDAGREDVVCCEEQTVSLHPPSGYNRLSVLGLAVNGSFSEEMTVSYKDGSREVKRLFLLDWYDHSKFPDNEYPYGEQLAILMPYHHQRDQLMEHPTAVWQYAVTIREDHPVESIRLPDNPFMYIFSITLHND